MKLNISIISILAIFMLISLSTIFSIGDIDSFYKQVIFWIISFLILISSQFISYDSLLRIHYFQFFYIISILILLFLFILPSKERIWFNVMGFTIQPSEFVRTTLIITLAIYISKYYNFMKNFYFLFLSFLSIAPFLFLIFLQPDMGMLILFLLTWLFSVLIFLTKKQIFILSIILILFLIISWFFVLKPYHKERILTFIYPEKDPLKAGYNLRQIKITIGSAGFWGKGFGKGTQARLGFLPSSKTDFLLTSFIEERGFIGFIFYVILFLLFLRTLLFETNFIKDPLGISFSNILIIHFGIKFILTTAVNLGIFPIIGLAIPFLSYGGSHLISDSILLAIWHNFRYK
ncbi:MAG: FtsW/RodA/SpoVE family cell cycle protein [Minisyncoccia bacterium]|jgi:rod shape determining protein RodA